MPMTKEQVDRMLKPVLLKDLRIQCRLRGLSPAGGKEQVSDRLGEDMIATNDFTIRSETGEVIQNASSEAGLSTGDVEGGNARNNYSRPEGQNVGNFLTDRNSSRVLAPPGGGSSIVFGGDEPAAPHMPSRGGRAPGALSHSNPNAMSADNPMSGGGAAATNYATNNYARPDGQNVGNFLTDRKAVRVAAPPGGASQITFG
eukprot:GHUV01001423.1.p1 GENE.GHUV01001423.1~~GHUV01001423.1.p1  ORF type:complete len:201 (+),score=61.65 GHUV01001423.1:186-788(+)